MAGRGGARKNAGHPKTGRTEKIGLSIRPDHKDLLQSGGNASRKLERILDRILETQKILHEGVDKD